MTGRAGIDAVSVAQSRWVGTGVEYSGTGPGRGWTIAGGHETVMVEVMAGVGSGQGVRTGVDSIIGEAAGVWDIGGSKTACFWEVWGEQSGWDMFWGCSEALCRVFCHFRVVGHGSEWCRAGGLVNFFTSNMIICGTIPSSSYSFST